MFVFIYMCTYIHVEGRNQHWVSFSITAFILRGRVSHWAWIWQLTNLGLPVLELQTCRIHGFWGIKLWSSCCVSSTWLTKPPPLLLHHFVVVEIWPRVSWMLGKHSTIELYYQAKSQVLPHGGASSLLGIYSASSISSYWRRERAPCLKSGPRIFCRWLLRLFLTRALPSRWGWTESFIFASRSRAVSVNKNLSHGNSPAKQLLSFWFLNVHTPFPYRHSPQPSSPGLPHGIGELC